MRKGKAVLVEARLQTSEWEDKQSGQKRSKLDLNAQRVTSLEWDDDRPGGGAAGGSAPRPAQADYEPTPPPMGEPVPEDDIPF
jgi:single-strand DNA-binding protein